MNKAQYLVIGDVSEDLFLHVANKSLGRHYKINMHQTEIAFQLDRKTPIEGIEFHVGGNAANVAGALAKLGMQVELLTNWGADEAGYRIEQYLDALKVSTQYVKRYKTKPTNTSAIILFNKRKVMFTYHHEAETLSVKRHNIPIVYLTSLGKEYMNIYEKVLRYINEKQILIYQPGTRQIMAGADKNVKVFKRAQLVIMNYREAEELVGRTNKPKSLLHKMLDVGCNAVVITKGKEGAFFTDGKIFIKSAVWHGVRLVETTGAGDTYGATFTAFQQNGFKQAAQAAAINAGNVLQYVGASAGQLSRNSLSKIMRKNTIRITKL